MAMQDSTAPLNQWKPRELLAGAVIARILGRHDTPPEADSGPPGILDAWHQEVADITGPPSGTTDTGPDVLRQRLEAVLERLSHSPTGRDLIESAHREDIDIRADPLLGTDGIYAREHRVAILDLMRLSDAQASLTMSRTFSHVRQSAMEAAVNARRHSAVDDALLHRVLQADATADACQVAWELKERTDGAVWEEARRHPTVGAAAEAFAKAVGRDATAAADGRARRAAYDGWFRLSGVTQGGDEMIARLHEGTPSPADTRPLETERLISLGHRPDGTNYFNLPGTPLPDDAVYRHFDANVAERLGRLTATPPPLPKPRTAPRLTSSQTVSRHEETRTPKNTASHGGGPHHG